MREASLVALSSPSEHLLRLGASTIPSGYLLPGVLSGFQGSHPHVSFEIQQGDSQQIFEKVLDGSVDLGFIGTEYPSSQCISLPFCNDELVLVMPATEHFRSLKQQSSPLSLLLKEPVILRESGSGTQKIVDQYLESLKISRQDLRIVAQVNDPEALKRMILKGMGVAICSYFAVKDLAERQQLLIWPLKTEIQRKFYIIHAKSCNLSPVLQEFIKYAAGFFLTSSSEENSSTVIQPLFK